MILFRWVVAGKPSKICGFGKDILNFNLWWVWMLNFRVVEMVWKNGSILLWKRRVRGFRCQISGTHPVEPMLYRIAQDITLPNRYSRLVFKWNPLEVRLVNCNSLPKRYICKWHKRHKRIPSKTLPPKSTQCSTSFKPDDFFNTSMFNFQFFNIILLHFPSFIRKKNEVFSMTQLL